MLYHKPFRCTFRKHLFMFLSHIASSSVVMDAPTPLHARILPCQPALVNGTSTLNSSDIKNLLTILAKSKIYNVLIKCFRIYIPVLCIIFGGFSPVNDFPSSMCFISISVSSCSFRILSNANLCACPNLPRLYI